MNLIIEDNIPLPRVKLGRKPSPLSLALRSMRPGQSVLAPMLLRDARRVADTLRRYGVKVAVRAESNGVRVWVLENPLVEDGK